MKYPHIIKGEIKEKQEKLVFSLYLNENTGELVRTPSASPKNWNYVRHLTGNLYYCWNNGGEDRGSVYYGIYE